VTSQKCPYHVTFDLDLDLDHTPWMQAGLGTIACKFGSVPAICLREEAIAGITALVSVARYKKCLPIIYVEINTVIPVYFTVSRVEFA